MTAVAKRSACVVESERLLVFGEAAQAVVRAASGRRLPAPLVAAIAELDQLGAQLHIGASVVEVEVEVELGAGDGELGDPSS